MKSIMQINYHFLDNQSTTLFKKKMQVSCHGNYSIFKANIISKQTKIKELHLEKTIYRIPKEVPITSHQGSTNCHNSPTKFPFKNYLHVVENNDKLKN